MTRANSLPGLSIMSSSTSGALPSDTSGTLPTAAILCLAIGVYVAITVAVLVVRHYLKTKEPICSSCSSLHPSKCCTWTNCDGCSFQRVFGTCKEKGCCKCRLPSCQTAVCGSCCGSGSPLFDCGRCDCTCSCQRPECSSINCCCFEIHIKR